VYGGISDSPPCFHALQEEAWVVADQMIRRPDLGIHALYFAAHTLHTKIMRDFAQLPVSSHNSLEVCLCWFCVCLAVLNVIVVAIYPPTAPPIPRGAG